MSREQGTFPFSANFEVKKKGTFDARQLVDRFEDLLAFTSANFIDTGFPVAVAKDSEYNGTSYLRGIYQCEDADNIDLESGWRNISSGGVAKDYDVAHYYEVDDVDNIAEENPTEDFLLVKDLEMYYFGQKQTNVVDFKNCRLTIGKQAYKKDFEEDDIIVTLGGYTFWKLGAPLSLDLTSGGSEAAFVYDRKYTSASVNLVDSLTSTSTIEALTANQGRVLKLLIDNFQGFSGDYNDLINRLELGETSTTAGRGDHTKAAYDYSQEAHAPIDAQKNSDITKAEIEDKLIGEIETHSHTTSQISDFLEALRNYNPQATFDGVSNPNGIILPSHNSHTIFIDGTGIAIAMDLPNEVYIPNYTIACKNINDTQDATLKIRGLDYWSYKVNNNKAQLLSTGIDITFNIPSGSTFTITRVGNTNELNIDGFVE